MVAYATLWDDKAIRGAGEMLKKYGTGQIIGVEQVEAIQATAGVGSSPAELYDEGDMQDYGDELRDRLRIGTE